MSAADAVEQRDAAAEEDGGEVDLQLVEQPGRERLLHDVRAAGHEHVLLARRRARLLDRGLDAVGDEV